MGLERDDCERLGLLGDRAVDEQRRAQDLFVEVLQARTECGIESLCPLDELHVESLRTVGERRIERDRILLRKRPAGFRFWP